MKRLLIQVFIFLTPLAILAIGVESFVRTIPNSYRFKKEWMDNNCQKVKTLILGNSHLNSAIIPSQMESAFNLTNSSQSLEYDSWLLSCYIKNCPNLETVLLSLDYHNLFYTEYEKANDKNNCLPIYYHIYMDYPKHVCLPKYCLELSCPRFLCGKVEDYIISRLKRTTYDFRCDSLGRFGSNLKNQRLMHERFIKKDIIRTSKIEVGNAVVQNTEYINKIVNTCKSRKIRLVLISTPFWHVYNENIDTKRLSEFYLFANYIKSKYKVEYYDFRDDDRISYNGDFFKDSHHLSDFGADKFTKMLKTEYDIQ